MLEALSFSQAVRIGDRIEISGQGCDPETRKVHAELADEINQAFANVELALNDAAGKGWTQVYRLRILALETSDGAVGLLMRNLQKWMAGP
ncbi:hypothetical protein N7492_003463 [Penicillium capsulatum]|uniref:Uncharacterized protein n=1 Tax=Penicillium capsulatum TaxID=69766 RepID=A0A9W9IJI7_9EURO|nr:hypothetical protein N7492_003463 [Penicillium capsulatum]